MALNRREKSAGILVVAGMFLTAADSLTTAIAGVALLGAGAVVLNWEEIRAKLRKIGSQRPRGAQLVARQPKPGAWQKRRGEFPAAVSRRTKKSPARAGTRTRQAKITTGTSYQKEEGMSSHV